VGIFYCHQGIIEVTLKIKLIGLLISEKLKMKKFCYLSLGAISAAVLFTPMAAQAFAIAAPGTEGLDVVVGNGGGVVTATFQGNSGSFSNDLYLMLDNFGNSVDDGNTANDLFVFNNQSATIGDTLALGTFADGQILKFRLFVNNTGDTFFTGAASLNPDNVAHARVEQNWLPNTALVSFEDLNGGPYDYNDLSFSFTPARSSATSVPEPFTVIGTLVGGTAAVRMRKKLKSAHKA
jgi:hypothetical protein